MTKRRHELVTHFFKGGRFDDHGVDVDVLPDLIAYKKILVETAKEIWRRKNPNRRRLPKNFDETLSLKFYEIRAGSAGVPLMREIQSEQTKLAFDRDELDEAVEMLDDAIEAIAEDKPLPEALPKNVIPLFGDYGKTLRNDEQFELRIPHRRKAACYGTQERERFIKLAETAYEDLVDYTGEIRAADLDRGNFILKLADGAKVIGKFSPEQETTITDALRAHVSVRLHVRGRAEFLNEAGPRRLVSIECLSVEPAGEKSYDETAKPIWEIAEEIGAAIPAEAWATVPNDAAENLDHYLYGHPRKGK
jgi:hypothetical protein